MMCCVSSSLRSFQKNVWQYPKQQMLEYWSLECMGNVLRLGRSVYNISTILFSVTSDSEILSWVCQHPVQWILVFKECMRIFCGQKESFGKMMLFYKIEMHTTFSKTANPSDNCLHEKYIVWTGVHVGSSKPINRLCVKGRCLRHLKNHSLISCGCLLLFTNMPLRCEHGSDGVSTWSKWDDCTLEHYPVMCRSIFPF